MNRRKRIEMRELLFLIPSCFDSSNFIFESWMERKAARFMPLGALSLAGYLSSKKHDMKLSIFDVNVELPLYFRLEQDRKLNGRHIFDRLIHVLLLEKRPQIVCISGLFHSTMHEVHRMASLVKGTLPETIIILGGAYPSTSPQLCLKDKNIDYIIVGEGELRLEKLLHYLEGSIPEGQLEGVYANDETIRYFPYRGTGVCLDDLPPLPLDIIKYQEYAGISSSRDSSYLTLGENTMSFCATRGCPNQCTYCNSGTANFYGPFRLQSIEKVINNIEYYQRQYGIEEFQLFDENIVAAKSYCKKLMRKLNRKGIRYTFANMELERIDEQILQLYFKNRDINFFSVGIESGSNRVLKEILRRRLSRRQIREKVEVVRRFVGDRAFINGSFMVGVPGEREEEIDKTIQFAMELPIDWASFFCYMPLPGTPLYKEAVKMGFVVPEETDFSRLDPSQSIVNMPHLSSEEITFLRNCANYKVNFVDNKLITLNALKAIKAFEYVLTVVPDHCFAYYGLSQCYRELKDYSSERNYYEKFRTVGSQEPWEIYVRSLLG